MNIHVLSNIVPAVHNEIICCNVGYIKISHSSEKVQIYYFKVDKYWSNTLYLLSAVLGSCR